MTIRDAARRVRENAYAPYSKFRVGAAVRAASGQIYMGCNVENIAYPEGSCAETGAIAAMVAAGESVIVEVCVIGSGPLPVPPCGGCRQRLAEFADAELKVVLMSETGEIVETTLGALLPQGFGPRHMAGSGKDAT